MASFAAALARTEGTGQTWRGWEAALPAAGDDDADLDSLAEELADTAGAAPVLLLVVEEDDEWFGIVRWNGPADGLDDPQVYLSDRRVLDTSELARRLFEDALPPAAPPQDGDDDEAGRPEIEPAGDVELLADLGTTGDRLIALTAEEGLLPSDILAALAESAGAADVLEEVRGA